MRPRRSSAWLTGLLLGASALAAAGGAAPLAAQNTGTITGTITDLRTGGPRASAQVSVPGTGLGTVSSQQGRYLLPNVPAGEVRCWCRASASPPWSAP